MNSKYKGLVFFIFSLIVMFSPFCIYNFYLGTKSLYFSDEYLKMKVKVDSIHISTSISSDGSPGSTDYTFYNGQYNIEITLLDNNNSIWKYLGDENLPAHATNFMRNHNDSIWVWYNPKAEIKYAIEDDVDFPIKKEIIYLILNCIEIAGAFYAIYWQIMYQKNKTKNKA